MKILKVEFHEETDTALFCWITYESNRLFRKALVKRDLYKLERYRHVNLYISIAYRCKDSSALYDVADLMLLSKKGVVEL